MIANILIDLKTASINFNYSYSVGDNLKNIIKIGQRVIVPFNNSDRLGFVIEIINEERSDLLYVKEVIDDEPFISDEFIKLCNYISKNTFISKNIVYLNLIPSVLFLNYYKEVELLDKALLPFDLYDKFKNNKLKIKTIDDDLFQRLKILKNRNIVSFGSIYKNRAYLKSNCYIKKDFFNTVILTDKMNDYLNLFNQNKIIFFDDIKKYNLSKNILNKMCSLGLIEKAYKEDKKSSDSLDFQKYISDNFIYKIISKKDLYQVETCDKFKKIEIIKQLYKNLSVGKCIYLVLESANLADFYYNNLKDLDKSYIYHPYIKDSLKISALNGEVKKNIKLLIGTKDIFLFTISSPEVIILDIDNEESPVSFDKFYFDIYDISKLKSDYNNTSILYLGAYPSVNIRYDLKSDNIYRLDKNNKKNIILSSIREDLISQNFNYLSKVSYDLILNNLENKKKVIIINSRKSDSLYLFCKNCFKIILCPKCSHAMKYYSIDDKLICPYCLNEEPKIKLCPNCSKNMLSYMGYGIEKTLKDIKKYFKNYNILYLPSPDYKKIANISLKEYDILISTRAILKSTNIPDDALIIFLNTDLDLKLPLYNSYEIVYKYLKNASSKTKNNVVVQTSLDDNFILNNCNLDYDIIYNYLLNERKLLNNPPFSNIYDILVLSNIGYLKTYQKAFDLKNSLSSRLGYNILGPTDARYYKDKKSNYIFRLTIKDKNINFDLVYDILNNLKEKNIRYKIFKYPKVI